MQLLEVSTAARNSFKMHTQQSSSLLYKKNALFPIHLNVII